MFIAFPLQTVVTRACLSVTLHLHCMSCYERVPTSNSDLLTFRAACPWSKDFDL